MNGETEDGEDSGVIINTGSRTDIPAYYSEWFFRRIREGFVLVRNPYDPRRVTRYTLSPDVVDAIVFCTKNPAPMFADFALLKPFGTFWFVTITPYGREIEPRVPDKEKVLDSFLALSELAGPGRMSWRYDPVFLSERYSVDFHIRAFGRMARRLRGSTEQCVVSFLDLYERTKRNFPEGRAVTEEEQEEIVGAFSAIASENGLVIHLCCENPKLARENVDADGCLSKEVLEKALGCRLAVPGKKRARAECACLLGADIGAYNTCAHGCRYCYANRDAETAAKNRRRHDRNSPFLIGGYGEGDVVRDAKQVSWRDGRISLFDLL